MSDPANDFFYGPLGIAWENDRVLAAKKVRAQIATSTDPDYHEKMARQIETKTEDVE